MQTADQPAVRILLLLALEVPHHNLETLRRRCGAAASHITQISSILYSEELVLVTSYAPMGKYVGPLSLGCRLLCLLTVPVQGI